MNVTDFQKLNSTYLLNKIKKCILPYFREISPPVCYIKLLVETLILGAHHSRTRMGVILKPCMVFLEGTIF